MVDPYEPDKGAITEAGEVDLRRRPCRQNNADRRTARIAKHDRFTAEVKCAHGRDFVPVVKQVTVLVEVTNRRGQFLHYLGPYGLWWLRACAPPARDCHEHYRETAHKSHVASNVELERPRDGVSQSPREPRSAARARGAHPGRVTARSKRWLAGTKYEEVVRPRMR